jgi:hypothetical protein
MEAEALEESNFFQVLRRKCRSSREHSCHKIGPKKRSGLLRSSHPEEPLEEGHRKRNPVSHRIGRRLMTFHLRRSVHRGDLIWFVRSGTDSCQPLDSEEMRMV